MMRTLVLFLFVLFFDSNADFSVEGVKGWFKEMFLKGSSEIRTGIEKLRSSSAGKTVGNFLDQTKDTLRENRSGTITLEFQEARKNFADYATKLNKELDEDIRSLSQLKDIQYHDRVVVYKNGKYYVVALEKCLAKRIENFVEAKAMKEAADSNMNNITNILTDELIYSYVADLREAYEAFNKAFERMEDRLKAEK